MFRISTGTSKIFTCALSIALSASLALAPSLACATPASDAQAEAEAALEQLNAYQAQLDSASNDYFEALAAQEEAQAKVTEAQAKIEEASGKITELQSQLGTRVNSMYRNGTISFLEILLGSASFEEFATNWDLLDQMNQRDADLTQQTKELREEVEQQKVVLTQQEKVAAEKTEEAKAIMDEASALTSQMQSTYDSLSAEAAELLEEERAAQSAAQAAAAQQEIAAQQDDGGSGYTEPPYNAATGNAVVDRALSYVGNAEYVWGACSPGAFDCSGFVSYCLTGQYARLGTTYTFLGWERVYDPQPGDVCVNSGHCGIYYGNGQMIHCSTYGVGVIISGVQSGMVYVRY